MKKLEIMRTIREKLHETWEIIIFLLILTCFSIALNGYYFGIGDHSIQIPFMKAYDNPSLYPNDLLLTQIPYYYTFFYYILALFIKYIEIETLFFVTFFISRFLMYFAIFILASHLFESEKTAYISTLLFFLPQPMLACGLFDSYMLARGFVFPFLLFSILLFLKQKYVYAFLLTGIMFNLHGMSASLVLFMFMFYFLLNFKRVDKIDMLKSISVFLLCAFPLLLWRFQMPSCSIFYADPEWVNILRIRVPHHIFPLSWSIQRWFGFLLISVLMISSFKYKPRLRNHKTILTFSLAILIMCMLGIIFTELVPLAIVINVQLLRSTRFFTIFAIIYISNYLIALSDGDLTQKLISTGIFTSLFLGISKFVGLFFLLLISLRVKEKLPRVRKLIIALSFIGFVSVALISIFPDIVSFPSLSKILSVELITFGEFILIFIFLFSLALGRLKDLFEPQALRKIVVFGFITILLLMSATNVYIRSTRDQGLQEDWVDVQLWCKNNTPKDSFFIVPPYFMGFRVYSERSILGDWKDGGVSNFNPAFAIKWWERMRDLGYTQENYKKYGKKEYNSLTEFEFEKLAKKYNATHVIVEKPKELNFTLSYENGYFRIYEMNDRS